MEEPGLIVGLGNPGPEYSGTRHNVGRDVVERLARRWEAEFARSPRRIPADLARAERSGRPVLLALPRTFMNESGRAVVPLARWFGVAPDSIVLVHDDIDLPFGRLRFQAARGTGGHRGVDSVARALGTLDFCRLKVGLGRPPGSLDAAEFVLRPFLPGEREEVDFMLEDGADVLEAFVTDGFQAAVQRAGERRPTG